jgi:ribose 5-phosphate isomerase B
MKIVVGGDHAGYELKEKVLKYLESCGHEVIHVGCFSKDMVDFPDIAKKVCSILLNDEAKRGIMVCGTGVGAAIACNKVPGIRASVVHDVYTAHQCVEHDHVQVMALGGQIVGDVVAKELIDIFLKAEYSESEEFMKRVAMLDEMDKEVHGK